jgi:hypothetical protein
MSGWGRRLRVYVRDGILWIRNDPAMLQASGAVTTTRVYLEPQSDLNSSYHIKTIPVRSEIGATV